MIINRFVYGLDLISLLIVFSLWQFQGLWLQADVALRRCHLYGQEVGNVRDRGNDSLLLLGTSDGSLAIVRAPIHGKWLKLLSFVRVFVLFDVFPPL